MRRALLLLGKDARLLRRSPLLLVLLVGYPLLVALLVALALQSGERKPAVALVNLDTSGPHGAGRATGASASRSTPTRLAQDVDLKRLDAAGGPARPSTAAR